MITEHKLAQVVKALGDASMIELEKIAMGLATTVGRHNAIHVGQVLLSQLGHHSNTVVAEKPIKVQLLSAGAGTPNYITAIKALRELTDLPLKEAKAAMDGAITISVPTRSALHALIAEMGRKGVGVKEV